VPDYDGGADCDDDGSNDYVTFKFNMQVGCQLPKLSIIFRID